MSQATAEAEVRAEACPAQPTRPKIVCLIGSTRFEADYKRIAKRERLNRKIVLTPGFWDHDGPEEENVDTKQILVDGYLHCIEMSDEVFVVNALGYIGEDTGNHLAYAIAIGKPVRSLERLDKRWQRRLGRRM